MQKPTISSYSAIALCSLSIGLAACGGGGGSSGGATTVDKTGDLSNPMLVHGRPDQAMIEACGDGAAIGAGADEIQRTPYLQQVTDGSAIIVFTTTAPDGLTVDVTRPDGTSVSSVDVVTDRTSHPSGATQVMARLGMLEPATPYCYAIRRGEEELAGRAGFRTAPPRGSETPFSFTAFGDFGDGGGDELEVFGQISDVPFDVVLMLGDVAYDSGTRAQLEDHLFSVYAPLMKSLPFWPESGNHEYETADAAPFREFFVLPENGGAAGLERWYSFDYGSVHFVGLDTEKVGDAQAAWLEADLSANDLPWTVVFFHKPPYSSGSHGSDMNVRNAFGPIFEAHHVSLVLSGHDHDYERMIPQGGVNYVVSGGGGHDLRGVGASDFTAFSASVLHFLCISVDTGRLVLHAIDASGREFDQLVVTHS